MEHFMAKLARDYFRQHPTESMRSASRSKRQQVVDLVVRAAAIDRDVETEEIERELAARLGVTRDALATVDDRRLRAALPRLLARRGRSLSPPTLALSLTDE